MITIIENSNIPLINIYYVGCMSFSLTAMVWFFLMNLLREYLEEHKTIPNACRLIVLKVICPLMCTKGYKIAPRAPIKSANRSNRLSNALNTSKLIILAYFIC